jgi:hypothetical protein
MLGAEHRQPPAHFLLVHRQSLLAAPPHDLGSPRGYLKN